MQDGAVGVLRQGVSGQPHLYTVSNPAPGMIGTYLRDEKDGKIYLLTGSLLSELEPSSQALVDRRLHTFRGPEFDEFVVSYEGGVKRAWLQKDAEIPQTMKGATAPPMEEPLSNKAVAKARLLLGNHSETAFVAAGQFADSPAPSRKRNVSMKWTPVS